MKNIDDMSIKDIINYISELKKEPISKETNDKIFECRLKIQEISNRIEQIKLNGYEFRAKWGGVICIIAMIIFSLIGFWMFLCMK